MFIYLVFSIVDLSYRTEINKFIDQAYRLIPSTFSLDAKIFNINDNTVLCYWEQKNYKTSGQHRINPGYIQGENGQGLFVAGHTQEGLLDAGSFFSLIEKDSPLTLRKSPGGVASFVFFSKAGHIYSWSSQPPAISTFYARNRQGFAVISNRPRLAYCASNLSLSYKPRSDYFLDYICSGCSLDSTTPYDNTWYIPPNQALRMDGSEHKLVPYPVLEQGEPISEHDPLEKKSTELADLLQQACWPAKYLPHNFLAMSGGKDSRTLLSTLSSLNLTNLNMYTFGGEGELETEVAKRVANAS